MEKNLKKQKLLLHSFKMLKIKIKYQFIQNFDFKRYRTIEKIYQYFLNV